MKLIAITLPALMSALFCSTVFALSYREGEQPSLVAPPNVVASASVRGTGRLVENIVKI